MLTETILAEWEQTFSNTAGSLSQPGMLAGSAMTDSRLQLIDLGDPGTLTVREYSVRLGQIRHEYLVDRVRTADNLVALQTGRLRYYLVQISPLTPAETVHRIVGSYVWSSTSHPGYDLKDQGSVWGEDLLDLANPSTPVRLRTILSPGNPELVHVIPEGRWNPSVYAGSATALTGVGLPQFEQVLTRCRRKDS